MDSDTSVFGFELVQRSRAWCVQFGLAHDWLESLLKEDTDWAFCIKIASIAEDTVREALESLVQPSALANLAVKQATKDRIELVVKLGFIDQPAANGLRAIAAVRNGYAHTVRNVTKPLSFLLDRSTNEGKSRFDQLADSYRPSPGDTPVERGWIVENQPRVAMWLALLTVMSQLYVLMAQHSRPSDTAC
jgi:hypothetical protein